MCFLDEETDVGHAVHIQSKESECEDCAQKADNKRKKRRR